MRAQLAAFRWVVRVGGPTKYTQDPVK
jgi:hypothetical protein